MQNAECRMQNAECRMQFCASYCQPWKCSCANTGVDRHRRRFVTELSAATAGHAYVALNGVSSVRDPAGGVYRNCSGKVEKPLAGYLALVGDLSETG